MEIHCNPVIAAVCNAILWCWKMNSQMHIFDNIEYFDYGMKLASKYMTVFITNKMCFCQCLHHSRVQDMERGSLSAR